MKLSIILFDGFTALDALGGYEVLARIPGIELSFVAAHCGVVAADTRRLGIAAYQRLDELTVTDILYVPGGPGAMALEYDESFLQKLRQLDATSTWTIGICNGVGLLAAAGLLANKEVTTNFFYRARVAQLGATVVERRYHRDGKYITGAGVSASIDAALFLAEIMTNTAVMKALALGIEYFPQPPYEESIPEQMPESIAALVHAYQNGPGTQALSHKPPFDAIVSHLPEGFAPGKPPA